MTTDDRLDAELRQLAGRLDVPAPDDALVTAVMTRIAAEPAPVAASPARVAVVAAARSVRSWLADRRRAAAVLLVALLLALALTPPVRAAVADWLGIGGVVVRPAESPAPSTAPPPPSASTGLTLEQARDLVFFAPRVPARLGTPDGVEVSGDRRVLSMSWDGRVRLDQFAAQLSPLFVKSVHGSARVEMVRVGSAYGMWLPEPHELVLLDADGNERRESSRLAGPTLVWETYGTTLRLEGIADRDRALVIAASAR
jgi:hypothetical protein